jgi:hypothetical protein
VVPPVEHWADCRIHLWPALEAPDTARARGMVAGEAIYPRSGAGLVVEQIPARAFHSNVGGACPARGFAINHALVRCSSFAPDGSGWLACPAAGAVLPLAR